MNPTEPDKRLVVPASEVVRLLGISRPKVYELMRREDFPVFKLGGRTLISVEGLRKWIAQQVELEHPKAGGT